MQDGAWEELATRLAEMARTLLDQDTVQGTLNQIVFHAIGLVDGCDDAGILTVTGPRNTVRTLAASSDRVRASDRCQGEVQEGPCFDAARRKHEVYRIADVSTRAERWPRYAPRARELGIGSVMGFLLFTEEDHLGSLDIYSSRPNAFTKTSEQIGWILASHAAVAFASARAHAQLEEAVQTRTDIGQALGIVMERYKVSDEEAFAVLRKSSQNRNVKLHDIARTVAETGDIPGAR
jgi:GAF domain-containing protein